MHEKTGESEPPQPGIPEPLGPPGPPGLPGPKGNLIVLFSYVAS